MSLVSQQERVALQERKETIFLQVIASLRYQLSDIKYQISSIGYQVSNIKYQISSIGL